MSDIFREVDEDLRRDRMERLFKRYGGLFITVAVLAVAGTAGVSLWHNWQDSRKQEETAALVGAAAKAAADPKAGVDALSAVAREAPADMGALARLRAAGLLAEQGRTADAVAVYDAIAADTAVSAVYRDLALLQSVMHQLDSGDPKLLQARLQPLAADTSPWRWSAKEMDAVLALRAGDRDRAHTLFKQLADDSSAPAGVRSRAADLAALHGKS